MHRYLTLCIDNIHTSIHLLTVMHELTIAEWWSAQKAHRQRSKFGLKPEITSFTSWGNIKRKGSRAGKASGFFQSYSSQWNEDSGWDILSGGKEIRNKYVLTAETTSFMLWGNTKRKGTRGHKLNGGRFFCMNYYFYQNYNIYMSEWFVYSVRS